MCNKNILKTKHIYNIFGTVETREKFHRAWHDIFDNHRFPDATFSRDNTDIEVGFVVDVAIEEEWKKLHDALEQLGLGILLIPNNDENIWVVYDQQ